MQHTGGNPVVIHIDQLVLFGSAVDLLMTFPVLVLIDIPDFIRAPDSNVRSCPGRVIHNIAGNTPVDSCRPVLIRIYKDFLQGNIAVALPVGKSCRLCIHCLRTGIVIRGVNRHNRRNNTAFLEFLIPLGRRCFCEIVAAPVKS